MGTRRVLIRVQIIDAASGGVVGQATRDYNLPDDLLQGSGLFASGAQDSYSAAVGGTGTAAYQNAFPRERKPS